MKIDNSVKISLIVVVALVFMTLIISNSLSKIGSSETINVEGVSEVSVVPDLVSVYLNIETLEQSANVAKDKNAEIVSRVKLALIDAGFDRDDFETQNFNIYEEFDWSGDGGRKSLGFKATHSIVVRVDAGDEVMIGKAIDVAVNNGALLGRVDFALSQELENKYKAKAMRKAAEDARVKAEAVADGLGVRLGDVVSTSVGQGWRYSPIVAYSNDVSGGLVKGSEVATNIQIKEQKVRSQISVSYKLR